jgi:glutamine synthetase
MTTAREVLDFGKKHEAVMVDLKFLDFVGLWQHLTVPFAELSEGHFEDGFGFDGSSIRAWQPIHASDMLLIPDASTVRLDPFWKHPTISLICDVVDPITKEPYTRDPRNIAKKALAYLRSTGIGDQAYFGPEAEFFVFDEVRFDQTRNSGFYMVDSVEGRWNTGREEFPNLGYKPRYKEGYFPVSPTDSLGDLRTEMCLELMKLGIRVETQHHEVATAGQCEIDIRFSDIINIGDHLMWFKYVIKNVAKRNGKTVTFMPKPLFEENGSGMHVHSSIWKDGQNLFAGDRYGGLSEMALHYIGGILKHARALCAITNPTTNSYRRLVPGYEAPVNLAYSSRNRSASIRIPITTGAPSRRIEYRTPDPGCNGYLAFAAILMAGLDGIENGINPGEPLDKDIYGLSPEELKDIPSAPGSLEEALRELEKDHEFLLKGGVFTEDAIQKWIEYKWNHEVLPMKMRPTPWEFALYYDI